MLALNKSSERKSGPSKRKSKASKSSIFFGKLQSSLALSSLVFVAFSILVTLVCFFGQSPASYLILPNQVARTRIVADFPFRYESKISTEKQRDITLQRLAPVYDISNKPYRNFETEITHLNKELDKIESKIELLSPSEQLEEIDNFLRKSDLEKKKSFLFNSEDFLLILQRTDSIKRKRLFEDGLFTLKEIFREGVFTPDGINNSSLGDGFLIQVQGAKNNPLTEEEALRFLRINLSALDVDPDISKALFRVLKAGLKPNVEYDPVATDKRNRLAAQRVAPVMVEVDKGQTIIEPGSRVTKEEYEQLTIYRQKMKETQSSNYGGVLFLERIVMTFALLGAALLIIQISMPKLIRNNKKIGLMALTVLINLTLIRFILELGDTEIVGSNTLMVSTLPYLMPITLSPIIVAIILGPVPAILVGILISTFTGLMERNSIEILLVSLFSCLVAIHFCRDVRIRSKVVKAGFYGGIAFALFVGILSLIKDFESTTLIIQIITTTAVGIITGMVVLGLLPAFEHLFKFTTDITLLELSDYNHPLLRRLQMEAPGTYHHSLKVAELAENAAQTINANPLICRVCSLFHDIGKLVKPEYFTENQRDGENPHLERNPSMSALVIKSHVKEGVEIAKKSKLPRLITDIIQQHHGTTLIYFFYDKAIRKQQSALSPYIPKEIDDGEMVEESTYRYDGPKPQFKESAIIFFADSIEAAGRSLPKVTPQSVEELIDSIVHDRLEDEQLSECAITFEELTKIKKSFAFTLLNMLHSRVEYPKKEEIDNEPTTEKVNATERDSNQ